MLKKTVVWKEDSFDFPIVLEFTPNAHRGRGFTVTYGKEIHDELDYETAAVYLGRSVLHALALQGVLEDAVNE